MAATKTEGVKTVTALSTRTISWWVFKRFSPGAGALAFCLYGIPAIVDAARAGGAS